MVNESAGTPVDSTSGVDLEQLVAAASAAERSASEALPGGGGQDDEQRSGVVVEVAPATATAQQDTGPAVRRRTTGTNG
jgi:hypothetical protein